MDGIHHSYEGMPAWSDCSRGGPPDTALVPPLRNQPGGRPRHWSCSSTRLRRLNCLGVPPDTALSPLQGRWLHGLGEPPDNCWVFVSNTFSSGFHCPFVPYCECCGEIVCCVEPLPADMEKKIVFPPSLFPEVSDFKRVMPF